MNTAIYKCCWRITVIAIGGRLLIFATVYQLFDATYIVYNGALRGAGDTLIPAIVTGTSCRSITMGGCHTIAKSWPVGNAGVLGLRL